jgi:predicted choloylglycine hydrolase
MTQNERLINLAGLLYILRDLLEDADFDRELKQRTKNYLAYVNRKVSQISDNPEVWEELDKLVQHFYDNLITEKQ